MPDELSADEVDRWCADQRNNVLDYLQREGFASSRIGEWPAWFVAPIISVWAIESLERTGWVGWWAVSGDFPTDYTACGPERHPRQALRDIGQRWQEAANRWLQGRRADGWELSSPEVESELAPLLASRAKMFLQYAADDGIWVD